MEKGFIKNIYSLREDSKTEDLLDFSIVQGNFKKKVDSIPGKNIFALIGPFGSGKSTMLNQLVVNSPDSEIWVEFDAWKYPDRKDLWEGFVLDVIKKIAPNNFTKTKNKIEGKQNNDKKTLITTLSKIPGAGALEGFNHFLETSPAKRIDDIQKILDDELLKIQKDIYIIIEDIDRSGDSGIFFLETLKQYLRTSEIDKKINIIVPISNLSYEKNIDSYLKCIDYFDFFELPNISLENFVSTVFNNELFNEDFYREQDRKLIWNGENRKKQTISFLESLFLEFPEIMSMRLLKLIIRKTNLIFIRQMEDGHEPDFRITLCVETSKYITLKDQNMKYIDYFKKEKRITSGNIFSAFLCSMLFNKTEIYENRHRSTGVVKEFLQYGDFNFIERKDNNKLSYPSYPWEYNSFEKQGNEFAIADFYKKY